MTATADEKIDLKTLGGYKAGLSSQKTMLPDKDVRVKVASKSVDKYCARMVKLAKEAKKRVADRKAAASAEAIPAKDKD